MRLFRDLMSSTELRSTILLATAFLLGPAKAISFPAAPSSNIDFSQLGRIAVAGNFDAASLYQYTQQSEAFSSNGSLSLLSRFPSGAFATLQASDAYINAMCPLIQGGKLLGVIVGGNFTSLGGVESPGIAMFNPDNSTITAIKGLSGKVNALYCDSTSGLVYVGGMFSVANATNAVARNITTWKGLAFTGFNGPVTSIVKAPDGNIVFGGSFDGLGNSTIPSQVQDSQIIPLSAATISAGPSSTNAGFSDPHNIICSDPNSDASGDTWLLADKALGSWTATFPFGFNPTKLRLRNTKIDGRGTKTFHLTGLPDNGIRNLSYVDPSGQTLFCDASCPLAENSNDQVDFTLVNPVGISGFSLVITDFYGNGAGLSYIELLENDIFSWAINSFNEPTNCGIPTPATAHTTGAWTTQPGQINSPPFLANALPAGAINTDSASVVFQPDIKQSGNYSVTMYTTGCLTDNTCNSRGRVNITGVLSAANNGQLSFQMEISQTNNYDKYDQIFLGHVDPSSSSFRPSITLSPSSGQTGPLTITAQRVSFELVSTTGGLNGLFEYNPGNATVDLNFRKSTIDSAATSLDGGAVVNALAVLGNTVYAGGAFGSSTSSNFLLVSPDDKVAAQGGLNGAILTMAQNNSAVYVGGSFTGTKNSGGPTGLNGVAAYNTTTNAWQALGAGVKGTVSYIVPFLINLSGSSNTDVAIAVSGAFSQINGFGGNSAADVNNFAVWIPSRNNWLQNLGLSTISVQGLITAGTDLPNGNPPLFAGSVTSFDIGADGAVQVIGNNPPALSSFPVQIQPPVTNSRKRAVSTQNVTGVVTGAFYQNSTANYTVLAGHFSAKATNGSTVINLLVIDGANSNKVSGITDGVDSNSTFNAVGIVDKSLFAGGSLSGNIRGTSVTGLIVYDLSKSDYSSTQPQTLLGSNVVVNAIAPQPSGTAVYVGGTFDSAGSFQCPGLCVYDTGRQQWSTPATNFDGSVSALDWVDTKHLLVAGNLTINGTSTPLALLDGDGHFFFSSAATKDAPAGTVTALTAGSSNGSAAWLGGSNADGSAFLTKYDGSKWNPVTGLGAGSIIRGLQIFTLTSGHQTSALLDKGNGLVILGQLILPTYGNVSAALYNGTTFQPFLLSAMADNSPGSLSQIFVQNPLNFFKAGRKFFRFSQPTSQDTNHYSDKGLAVGFIVLIGLAISLAILFLLIACGFLFERARRRRAGYVIAPSPTNVAENVGRIPPEQLLAGTLSGGRSGRGWKAG
jgi:hypothetical protein